jgi:hypothetical protein
MAQKPASMRWEFDPDIPTHDFLEDGPPADTWKLQEAVENFVWWLETDQFLTWEAVVCQEQGLPLTAGQKKALGGLLSFNDEEDDQVLYIDETPRPSEPWHTILNRIVPHLLIEPFKTFEVPDEVRLDGWNQIVTALDAHGQGLSLPAGAASHREVVPADMRHRLWLQYCFDVLSGLGQDEELTLANEDQQDRIDWFIGRLRQCKESIAHFGLTLESLLARVVLPDEDRPIFVRMMQEKLGLGSAQEPIAGRL